MEHAFAIQKYAEFIHVSTSSHRGGFGCRSEGKLCGICMEAVLCKVSLSDRRFGILSKSRCIYPSAEVTYMYIHAHIRSLRPLFLSWMHQKVARFDTHAQDHHPVHP